MEDYDRIAASLLTDGFTVVNNVFSSTEISTIVDAIENTPTDKETFRKTKSLFAIRQVLKEIPLLHSLLFREKLLALIHQVFGDNYFVVKSIYFDKPPGSNWFVSWHQDLTISVKEKQELTGFGPWTVKQNQFSVQPPTPLLENIFTVRIHLDDTDENNGALQVAPGSHAKGVMRSNKQENRVNCTVACGGIMLMKPLLWHGSGKSTNDRRRRVVHIEFSNQNLPEPLQWSEYMAIH